MNIKRATHIARHNVCVQVQMEKAVHAPKGTTNRWLEFWKIVLGALEKQKPKTPDIWGDGYSDGKLVYDMWDCPNCGESYEIDYHDYKYCPNCGQRIDRRVIHEEKV